jgi:hypothetical protein
MSDLTTRPAEQVGSGAGSAETPVLDSATVNGTAVGDRRTLRQASRAEQQRLTADAEVERHARAARLDLELSEQRRAAARRERHADQQERQARGEQRRAIRAARHARWRAAAPRWADRALFILPILFPMAVAWVGQIRFAMTVMHWPLLAAIVFAAGFELSTAYAARLDWLARAAGDSALLFRAATWGFACGAATMNYWHAAGPDLAPTGEAVSYGLMSITGVVLWELLSTYRHRTALRAEGKLPAARPRYGLARWIWFRPLTHLASLLALRDGYTTTDLAWKAALAAVDRYGSARGARKAVRAGRPVPLTVDGRENEDAHSRDVEPRDETLRELRAGHTDVGVTCRYMKRDWPGRDDEQDTARGGEARDVGKRVSVRDAVVPGDRRDIAAEIVAPARGSAGGGHDDDHAVPVGPADAVPASTAAAGDLRDLRARWDETTNDGIQTRGHNDAAGEELAALVADGAAGQEDDKVAESPTGGGDCPAELLSGGKGAVIAKMRAFARERAAQGDPLTGADLDRHFGTRDYGRKVLRQLAAESNTEPT